MDIQKITIPLSDDDLDNYLDKFDTNIFLVDYDRSEYKNKLFLNYIYNSGMTCDIEFQTPNDDIAQLMIEYVKHKKQFNIQILNILWNTVIHYYLKKECSDDKYKPFIISFINNNKDLIEEMINVINSLKFHLFNIIVTGSDELANGESRTYELLGENFISIRNDPEFWLTLAAIDELKLPIYNYSNFEEMSFEGKKISYYFLNEYSPFSMLLQLKTEGDA